MGLIRIGAERRGDDAEVTPGEDACRGPVESDVAEVEGFSAKADGSTFGDENALV